MENTKGVLIIENDVGIANMIRAILGIIGVKTTHVFSQQEAEDALDDTLLGMIICDKYILGNNNSFITQIREQDNTKELPVIMLVSEEEVQKEQKKPEPKADRFITKPFTAQKVMDVVKEFIVYKTA